MGLVSVYERPIIAGVRLLMVYSTVPFFVAFRAAQNGFCTSNLLPTPMFMHTLINLYFCVLSVHSLVLNPIEVAKFWREDTKHEL